MDAPDFAEDTEDQMDGGDHKMDLKPQLVVEDELKAEVDPSLAEWFKVEPEDGPQTIEDSDTETDDDSDHDELPPDSGDDDWLNVSPEEAQANPDVTMVCLPAP